MASRHASPHPARHATEAAQANLGNAPASLQPARHGDTGVDEDRTAAIRVTPSRNDPGIRQSAATRGCARSPRQANPWADHQIGARQGRLALSWRAIKATAWDGRASVATGSSGALPLRGMSNPHARSRVAASPGRRGTPPCQPVQLGPPASIRVPSGVRSPAQSGHANRIGISTLRGIDDAEPAAPVAAEGGRHG